MQTAPASGDEMTGDLSKLPIELRALFTAFQKPRAVSRNRRSSPRRQFVFPVTLHVHEGSGVSRTVCVHTRDRNADHISFLTEAHLKPATAVVLDFTASPQTMSMGRIEGRIRRCRQFREGWFECLVQVGASEPRRETTAWARLKHWVGETTGFGPHCRREASRYRRTG